MRTLVQFRCLLSTSRVCTEYSSDLQLASSLESAQSPMPSQRRLAGMQRLLPRQRNSSWLHCFQGSWFWSQPHSSLPSAQSGWELQTSASGTQPALSAHRKWSDVQPPVPGQSLSSSPWLQSWVPSQTHEFQMHFPESQVNLSGPQEAGAAVLTAVVPGLDVPGPHWASSEPSRQSGTPSHCQPARMQAPSPHWNRSAPQAWGDVGGVLLLLLGAPGVDVAVQLASSLPSGQSRSPSQRHEGKMQRPLGQRSCHGAQVVALQAASSLPS